MSVIEYLLHICILSFVTCILSVDASWNLWTRWSPCSQTCGAGASRIRSRTFMPARHLGKTPPKGPGEQTQDCSKLREFPTPCPKPARASNSWESWSRCAETCYQEGSIPPLVTRRRRCIHSTLSSNWKFNNIANCSDLAPALPTDSKVCDIKPCPGKALRKGNISTVRNITKGTTDPRVESCLPK